MAKREEGEATVATNRRARHEYHVEDTVEAGLVLTGSEVKSLRQGKASLQEAYCTVERGEGVLVNATIPPYSHGGYDNHEPTRPRRLLLSKKELAKLDKAVAQKGYTLVPLKLYFKNGWAKLLVGVAKGKKLHDKRHDIAERDAQRRIDRAMREH